MRRKFIIGLVLAALAAITSTSVWNAVASDGNSVAQRPTVVAILDLAKVFQSHSGFKQAEAALLSDVKLAEQNVADKRKAIADAQQSLAAGGVDVAKTAQAVAWISHETAQITKIINQHKQDLASRESAIYADVYQKIMEAVTKLAESRGIELVLRFSGDSYDLKTGDGLKAELNKLVLFHKGVDITDEVIRAVNATAAK